MYDTVHAHGCVMMCTVSVTVHTNTHTHPTLRFGCYRPRVNG